MALTPEEQSELDQLELEQLEAEYAASELEADSAPVGTFSQSTAEEPWRGLFNSREEFEAARTRQATEDVESAGSKAKMAGRALGSAALKVGLPAAAVAASPFTGGASLAALGGVAAIVGEVAGNTVAGEESTPGGVAAAGILGATPLRSLVGATPKQALGIMGKSAGATVAADAVESGNFEGAGTAAAMGGVAPFIGRFMDTGRRSQQVALRKIQNEVRDRTAAEARQAGYVIPSTKLNPTGINNLVESFAGKAATGQEAAIRNQEITNALARKALGLPPEASLTSEAMQDARAAAAAPYREIASLSPKAAQELDQLKQARFDAADEWKHYHRSGDPSARKRAVQLDGEATKLETKLENRAILAGRDDLVKDMKEARKQIAKVHEVDKALNAENVDASKLARSVDRLTDDLAVIARFNKHFPSISRLGQNVPAPGVSKLRTITPVLFGGAGTAAFGPAGLAAAGIPLLEGPTRQLVLSQRYQQLFGQPFHGNSVADVPSEITRFLTQGIALSPQAEASLQNPFQFTAMPPIQKFKN